MKSIDFKWKGGKKADRKAGTPRVPGKVQLLSAGEVIFEGTFRECENVAAISERKRF
jgi:hypothetical protein